MCVCICVCIGPFQKVREREQTWDRHSSTHPLFLQRSCNSLQTKHNQIHVGILNKNREGRPRGKNAIRITSGTSGVLPGVLQVFWFRFSSSNVKGGSGAVLLWGVDFHRSSHPSSAHGEPGPSPLSATGFTGPVHSLLFLWLCLHAGGPGSAGMFVLWLWKGLQFLQLHILLGEQHWA